MFFLEGTHLQETFGTNIGTTTFGSVDFFVIQETNGTFVGGITGPMFQASKAGSSLAIANPFANGTFVPRTSIV